MIQISITSLAASSWSWPRSLGGSEPTSNAGPTTARCSLLMALFKESSKMCERDKLWSWPIPLVRLAVKAVRCQSLTWQTMMESKLRWWRSHGLRSNPEIQCSGMACSSPTFSTDLNISLSAKLSRLASWGQPFGMSEILILLSMTKSPLRTAIAGCSSMVGSGLLVVPINFMTTGIVENAIASVLRFSFRSSWQRSCAPPPGPLPLWLRVPSLNSRR